ncbi:MAG: thymidylate synthase [Nanoarchaeota archaeon]
MEQYHSLLKEILGRGDVMFEPRTEEFILGLGGWQSIYDLRDGFPLMTTKNVPPRLPFEELFWKLRGERNVKSLVDRNVHIWTANAFDRHLKKNGLRDKFPKHSSQWNEKFKEYSETILNHPHPTPIAGDLGPVYGYQWRHWKNSEGKEIDQLENLLNNINEKPGSRYHLLSAWNVGDLPEMALGPCPMIHQFSVFGNNLDLSMYQRSCDVFLGVPFNIAQDSLFLAMMAKHAGSTPRKFIHSYGNVHSYLGVSPRSDFWMDSKNVKDFQYRFRHSERGLDYLSLRAWYLNEAPPEREGSERKDHIPFILEQLSKSPRPKLPSIELKDVPFREAVEMNAMDYATIKDYNPEKWDSKAEMAA